MSRLLTDLSPIVRPRIDEFLSASRDAGLDLLVVSTLRTFQEQQDAWDQGRTKPGPDVSVLRPKGRIVTKARPGQSAHNYGMAIDVVPIVGGKPLWKFDARRPGPVWALVGRLGQDAGLEWFGDPLSEFIEGCHFQHPNWKSMI